MHFPRALWARGGRQGGAHAGGSGQTKQLEGGGSTAGGGASTASFAAARPPRPLPRSLRLMRGVDTAVTLFSLLLQLSLALRWGGGLSGCQLLHQAALVAFRSTALYLALRLPTRAWYRYRVLLIFALRLSIATVPSQRSAQDGDAVLLARPTTPGAAGAAKDWLRMLTGTRLLQMSLIGSLLLQPPLAVAAQQAALMYLTSDNAAFCGTRLLQDPLSQRRLAALWSFMQGWAQLAAALSTAVAPDAAHVPAHLLPRVRCLAVLTFHQSFLGILLPVIVAACTAPGPLPLALLEARGVPAGAAVAQTSVAPCAGVGSPAQQAGRVRRAAAASLAAAWKACVRADEQVRERCLAACGSAQEAGVLAGACALLAANVWVLSVAGAARSAAGEVL